MKQIKPLKFEDLSLEQKLGLVSCGYVLKDSDWEDFDSNLEYTLDAIRNHRLGSVWMSPRSKSFKYAIEKIKEAADYPVLIFADAESGIGEYMIGKHNALGSTDNEEYAYAFGKVVGVTARKMGLNVVCDPVVDAFVGARYLGTDKYKVAKLGIAMAKGLHDAGILNVAKHYPSAYCPDQFDSHMAPAISYQTEEELIETSLYPYIELNKQGLIDGIMTGHTRLDNIDYGIPTSLSKKVIDIIKNQGFNGFFVTDGLRMMSIRNTFGEVDPKGMCIEAGNTVALDWEYTKRAYDAMVECYNKGILSEERLNEAVKKILETQEKVLNLPEVAELTEKDIETFNMINKDSVFAKVDEGVSVALDRNAKHFFAIMVENGTSVKDDGKVTIDTFSTRWFDHNRVKERLLELFPNSKCHFVDQFPSPHQNMVLLGETIGCDDYVFLTYTDKKAYGGNDRFTSRLLAVMKACCLNAKTSGKDTTVVHFGTATALEDLPDHFPRVIIGGQSHDCVDCTLNVLAGLHEAKGHLTYNVNLK